MRSVTFAAAAMAMATAVSAQLAGFAVFATPAEDEVVFAGKPYVLKWVAGKDAKGKDAKGPATIALIGGETQGTQVPISTLTTLDVSTNTYTWNVDCSLGKAKVYGLSITMVDSPTTFQWSNRFHIDNSGCAGQDGNPAAPSSSAVASTSASTPTAGSAYPTATLPASSSSSSHAVSSSAQSSSVATVSSSVVVPTLTKSQSVPAVQTTSSATKPAATASQSTTASTPIPTAAAPKVAAGSLALAGAAVAAVLAL